MPARSGEERDFAKIEGDRCFAELCLLRWPPILINEHCSGLRNGRIRILIRSTSIVNDKKWMLALASVHSH